MEETLHFDLHDQVLSTPADTVGLLNLPDIYFYYCLILIYLKKKKLILINDLIFCLGFVFFLKIFLKLLDSLGEDEKEPIGYWITATDFPDGRLEIIQHHFFAFFSHFIVVADLVMNSCITLILLHTLWIDGFFSLMSNWWSFHIRS